MSLRASFFVRAALAGMIFIGPAVAQTAIESTDVTQEPGPASQEEAPASSELEADPGSVPQEADLSELDQCATALLEAKQTIVTVTDEREQVLESFFASQAQVSALEASAAEATTVECAPAPVPAADDTAAELTAALAKIDELNDWQREQLGQLGQLDAMARARDAALVELEACQAGSGESSGGDTEPTPVCEPASDDTVQEDTPSNSADLAQHQEQIASMQHQLDVLEAEKLAWRQGGNDADASLQAVTGERDEALVLVDDLTTQLASARADVGEYQSQLSSLQIELDNLRIQEAAVSDRMVELQSGTVDKLLQDYGGIEVCQTIRVEGAATYFFRTAADGGAFLNGVESSLGGGAAAALDVRIAALPDRGFSCVVPVSAQHVLPSDANAVPVVVDYATAKSFATTLVQSGECVGVLEQPDVISILQGGTENSGGKLFWVRGDSDMQRCGIERARVGLSRRNASGRSALLLVKTTPLQ